MKAQKRDDVLRFSNGDQIKNYRFGSLKPTEPHAAAAIGEGGSAVVYQVEQILHSEVGGLNEVSIPRAIKFFYYRDDLIHLTKHGNTGPVSKQDFLAEVANLSGTNHEHLVKIIDAGIHSISGVDIPYLVSQFVAGPTLRAVIENHTTSQHAPNISALRQTVLSNPIIALDWILQLGKAICYLHANNIAHCDIAPKNVFIETRGQPQLVLGDLGIAKSTLISGSTSKVFVAGSKSFIPQEVLKVLNSVISREAFLSLQPQWDLYSFALTSLAILDLVPVTSKLSWLRPLRESLESVKAGKRYLTAQSIFERLLFLQPIHRETAAVIELSGSFYGRSSKLLPITKLQVTKRLRKLIDHPAILRLAKVPQLTVADNVFPGAVHNRYEHSLGVLETTRQYLLALLDREEFLSHLSKDKIELCLLSALLWNATRFPLSNVIHEVKEKNLERLSGFSRKNLLPKVLSIKDQYGLSLEDTIRENFPGVCLDSLKMILTGNKSIFEDEDHLVYSFFNSSIDTRVIDFVRRDALHLGMTSGEVFHVDDLLPHLTINGHRLALNTTGVAVAEQIISLRYWLFSRIYWSRPNRAFVAMIRHLIMELFESPEFLEDFQNMVLFTSQSELLNFIFTRAKVSENLKVQNLAELLNRPHQELYRIALDISIKDDPTMGQICRKVAKMDHAGLRKLGGVVRSKITKSLMSSNGMDPGSIYAVIIDMPDEPDSAKLGEDVIVMNDNKVIGNLREYSGIVKGINESFDEHLRRLRVFIHPSIFPSSAEPEVRNRLSEDIKQQISDFVS